jgi:hypothetical protein
MKKSLLLLVTALLGAGCDNSAAQRSAAEANDWRAKAAAAEETLKTVNTSISIEAKVRKLSDPDIAVRRATIYDLGELGSAAKPAVPALTEFLNDANEQVRNEAALALRKIHAGIGSKIMNWVFSGIMHIAFVGSLCFLIFFIGQTIVEVSDPGERLVRAGAIVFALAVYMGSKSVGMAVPQLLRAVLNQTQPPQLLLFGIGIPFVSGMLVSSLSLWFMRSNVDRAKRLVVILCSFSVVMFVDIYAALVGEMTMQDFRFALPNLTFIAGGLFWLVLRYDRRRSGAAQPIVDDDEPEPESNGRGRTSRSR